MLSRKRNDQRVLSLSNGHGDNSVCKACPQGGEDDSRTLPFYFFNSFSNRRTASPVGGWFHSISIDRL